MKRYPLLAGVFLLCFILTACGKREDAPQGSESTWIGMAPGDDLAAMAERTEYYDLTVQSERLFDLNLWENNPQDKTVFDIIILGGTVYFPLGTQFWKGEPVQLWTEVSSEIINIWLYGKDGSGELLLQDAPGKYSTHGAYEGGYRWYMDQSGDFYCYRTISRVTNGEVGPAEATIAKILPSGEILYETTLNPGITIKNFCQTEDGRIYLLLREEGEEMLCLAELDPVTGTLIPASRWELSFKGYFEAFLGTAGGFPAVYGYCDEDSSDRILKVDTSNGSQIPVLYFAGTSYSWAAGLTLEDFQVLGDGSIELLLTDSYGQNCCLEQLKMEKVEKIPIVLRTGYQADSIFREKVTLFNAENDTYRVIIEDCKSSDDMDDFARLTSVQMNAGGGPDILYGCDLMEDYIAGMLEKGALENLSPYMEASGIREEDYFPAAFSAWRQGEQIYGISYLMAVRQRTIDEEVLGNRETPDMETLVDALLSREGTNFYISGYDSGQILRDWLEGTDSLWGMVDWENGSCDFNTPLFENMLEAARRYGDDGRKTPELAVAGSNNLDNVVRFSDSVKLEASGEVISGTLFDDGCYTVFRPVYILAINANSANKEGAWEFIRFLLGEEIQGANQYTVHRPVNRKAFEEWMEWTIAGLTQVEYVNGVMVMPLYEGEEVSEERKAEYIKTLEEARPLPMRTAFILKIILEEAEDYFNGYKSAEEVSKVINNRVQLYLDENR